MNITLLIPDDVARKLADAPGDDLARRALEAFAVEEYRSERLTDSEMCRLLGLGTRYELDGFLKARGVYLDDGGDALDRDREALVRLGF